jgi:hypothetical protein
LIAPFVFDGVTPRKFPAQNERNDLCLSRSLGLTWLESYQFSLFSGFGSISRPPLVRIAIAGPWIIAVFLAAATA